jgi:hypothetical protein
LSLCRLWTICLPKGVCVTCKYCAILYKELEHPWILLSWWGRVLELVP